MVSLLGYYRLSEDRSVVGMDNIGFARFCVLTFTTLEIDCDHISDALCDSLLAGPPIRTAGATLILRESTSSRPRNRSKTARKVQ